MSVRLTGLGPRWWTRHDGTRLGISFACPIHAGEGIDADGQAPCRLGRIFVHTEPLSNDNSGEKWATWTRLGDDFGTMSLTPSIRVSVEPGRTHWHGWVKGGQVSILPDSQG